MYTIGYVITPNIQYIGDTRLHLSSSMLENYCVIISYTGNPYSKYTKFPVDSQNQYYISN